MIDRAIQVKLEPGTGNNATVMAAYCMGERTIVRELRHLPKQQPAYALAKLMCHYNKWGEDDLVYGLLPNGDEVFCFRHNGRE